MKIAPLSHICTLYCTVLYTVIIPFQPNPGIPALTAEAHTGPRRNFGALDDYSLLLALHFVCFCLWCLYFRHSKLCVKTVEGLYCKRPIQCLASSEIWPPHLTARRVCPSPVFGSGGGHTRWVERGWESKVRKTPDTALYSIYVSTLWSKPKRFRQEKQENTTRFESHLSFSLETGASVCLLSTTTGGAPPHLRQHLPSRSQPFLSLGKQYL